MSEFDCGCESHCPAYTRWIYHDLVGRTEIAERLGVHRDRAVRWTRRAGVNGSPKPKVVLGKYKIYSMAEWRGWYALWGVMKARKPKSDSNDSTGNG